MPINSRAKGAAGEREVIHEMASHLGEWVREQVKRNLDQTREGGHDIVGLGSWALEIKRYAKVTESDMERFWRQAVEQAVSVKKTPALAYRVDRKPWRIRVPMSVIHEPARWWPTEMEIQWTVEVGMEAFCYLIRESMDVPVS